MNECKKRHLTIPEDIAAWASFFTAGGSVIIKDNKLTVMGVYLYVQLICTRQRKQLI